MNISIKKILISLFIVTSFLLILFLSGNISFKKQKKILNLNKDLDIIRISDSIRLNKNTSTYKYKSVCFVDGSAMWSLKYWLPYIKRYNNIPFVFYVKTNDKKTALQNLQELNFPLPIFIEPIKEENDPYKVLMIGYIVNNRNEIIQLANPLLPEFSSILKKYSILNKREKLQLKNQKTF